MTSAPRVERVCSKRNLHNSHGSFQQLGIFIGNWGLIHLHFTSGRVAWKVQGGQTDGTWPSGSLRLLRANLLRRRLLAAGGREGRRGREGPPPGRDAGPPRIRWEAEESSCSSRTTDGKSVGCVGGCSSCSCSRPQWRAPRGSYVKKIRPKVNLLQSMLSAPAGRDRSHGRAVARADREGARDGKRSTSRRAPS